MSVAGAGEGCCPRARVSRLVSFSATHRLHRWGAPTVPTVGGGVRVWERRCENRRAPPAALAPR